MNDEIKRLSAEIEQTLEERDTARRQRDELAAALRKMRAQAYGKIATVGSLRQSLVAIADAALAKVQS